MFTKVVIFSHIRKAISLPGKGGTPKTALPNRSGIRFPTDGYSYSQRLGTGVPDTGKNGLL